MNILEVSFLVADLTILIGGFAMFNHFNKRQKRQDKIIASLNERIFEVETSQRYDLKFEMSELKNKQDEFKNKQELLEVKISKAQFDFEQVYETLAKSILKTMSIKKVEQEETKPSESVQNQVVDLIKDDSITIDEVTQQTELNFQEKPKRKPRKKGEKTMITESQIEESFIERYGMTYYGYRKMYGEKKFINAKNNAYMKVYYKQITKKEKK
jgi:hypothetical protein